MRVLPAKEWGAGEDSRHSLRVTRLRPPAVVGWGPPGAWGVGDITTLHLRTERMVPSLKAFGLAEFSKGQKNMGQSHSHPAWRGQSQIPLCPAAQVGPGERERSTPPQAWPGCVLGCVVSGGWCSVILCRNPDPAGCSGNHASAVHLARAASARTWGSH